MSPASSARRCCLLCAGLALLAACQPGAERLPALELNGSTMGTTFNIILVSPQPRADLDRVRSDIERELWNVEASMSTYLQDSEVSAFNRHGGREWFPVSAAVCEVVETALAVSDVADNAFDVTVAPLVDLWGFGPDFRETGMPSDAALQQALDVTGAEHLDADCSRPAIRKDVSRLRIDLSGVAKGYAVDRVADMLARQGFRDYLVEIGGELWTSGNNADGEDWAVAIESPDASRRSVQRIIRVTGTAVASSGDYRNFFDFEGERYSHLIDPRTGYPIRHRAAAVTVLADRAATADALATALLVLGPDEGLALAARENIAALFLLRNEGEVVEMPSPAFTELAR